MFQESTILTLNHFERTDTAPDIDADRLRRFRRDLEPGRFQGVLSCANSELNKPPHLLDFFLVDELTRIETPDFACNSAAEVGGIELSNGDDATPACQNGLPSFFRTLANRR
jgi:hypothetical protein